VISTNKSAVNHAAVEPDDDPFHPIDTAQSELQAATRAVSGTSLERIRHSPSFKTDEPTKFRSQTRSLSHMRFLAAGLRDFV